MYFHMFVQIFYKYGKIATPFYNYFALAIKNEMLYKPNKEKTLN